MTTEFLQDEQGGKSSGRLSFWVTLVVTLSLIIADAFSTRVEVPGEAYALLGGLLTALVFWTAGPRIAQYAGPAISGLAAAVASAVRGKVSPGPAVEGTPLPPVANPAEEER